MGQERGSISFDNTKNAFAYKSDKELKKAHFLFSSMGYQFLVSVGIRLTKWAIKMRLPVNGIIKNTIFQQFVGGETLAQTAPVARKLGEFNVQVILDYGVEGGESSESAFDHACEEFIRVIRYAATQPNIPFMSIKVTGIARFSLLEKLDKSAEEQSGSLMKRFAAAYDSLTKEEKGEWDRVKERIHKICTAAGSLKIGVLVDAEETWIQDPVDVLTMQMMDEFNKQKAIVYNTIQLYRHDRFSFLKDSITAAEQRSFVLGVKLVRGAYMEKERARAEANGYPSPIQPDKGTTDKDYNAALRLCVDHIDNVSFIVASHNEYSNLLATELLDEKGYSHRHPHVHFSQLYGMSDNITFNLAGAGCSVSKYLPFGPIRDVVPYLMRRAQENSSVAGQTGRELGLIKKEIARRKKER
ncbi:proline dehydrogenase family protein [Pollutibacter soli]|uniref:proline dehydrogenase family protein n=1 Tax=Pollutibacter soli TaxID=3034157 RepID=UPI00301403B6